MTRRSKSMDAHKWETQSSHGGVRPGTYERWENRIEKCRHCDARRQRRLLWNVRDAVVEDYVDATAPTPLPATCPI